MDNNKYGYYDKNGSEYVVTEVNTVLPFVNYFWNNRFISGVSQHMAGIGCFTERPMQYMHPDCRSLLVRNENRHFYLRDSETGEIWSPGWYPVLRRLDSFSCRHGLGYSILESSLFNIRIKMRVFVPGELPAEIWSIAISNHGSGDRAIQLYTFVDWLLTGYQEYCDYNSSLHSEYRHEKNTLVCYNSTFERPHDYFNGFIASNLPPSGFDSSRKAFMGHHQISSPQAVLEGKCRNSIGVCEKLVGVLEHTIKLKPGEEKSFDVIIGATDSMTSAEAMYDMFFVPGRIEEEFNAVIVKIFNDYNRFEIRTPEEKINCLFNNWIKRSVQLHSEVGTDTGRGFRDILQAAWAVAGYDHEGAKQKIIECLRHQFSDGHTLRGWNPVDTHHYSDGPVWIAPAVDSYLKETGDFGFLDIVVPYFDRGEDTIWGHTLTAIRHSSEDTGPHGLIKAHFGDWNDSLNGIGIGGIGESVWTAIALVFSINTAIEIASEVKKDRELVLELAARKEKLEIAVENYGWDGKWYLEGINDAGEKIGSQTETEGRIYLNPQTWAIMAGIAGAEKIREVVSVIDNDLECDYGSLVLTPAYRVPNPGIGRITWFVPGMWENASPYCHGTAFKIVADTFLKRGNAAYNSMMKVLPDSDLNPSSHSGCPPYMVTNMYYGPEHPRAGQILYSWITGTADWLLKAVTGYILGVRATYGGLLVDPCVPSHWRNFSITRSYLGATYEVEFLNPDGKQSGIKTLEADGVKLQGNILPVFNDGRRHKVKVIM